MIRPLWSGEAEQSVLGALLLDDDVYDDVAAEGVCAESFYDARHRNIWRALSALRERNEPLDVVTAAEQLEGAQLLDKSGGAGYLSRLVDLTPSVDNVIAYARIVREREIERVYLVAAQDMLQVLQSDAYDDHASRVAQLQTILAGTERDERANTMQCLKEVLKSVVERADIAFNGNEITGLRTGFQHIDYRLGGLQPADLIIVAARPGMGKTAYITNILRNAALEQKVNSLVFSLEMPNFQLGQRMVAAQGKVNLGLIKSGKALGMDEQATRFGAALTTYVQQAPERVWFDDEASLPISELVARAKRLDRQHRLGLVVVDHVGLVESTLKTENESQRISQVTRALKKLAKQLQCPVIALSQVNRECEKRANKRPILSDLRGSGAIEQDADVIQFLYRDEYYNENTDQPGQIEVISAKVRSGERGVDYLTWNGAYQRMDTREFQPVEVGQSQTVEEFV